MAEAALRLIDGWWKSAPAASLEQRLLLRVQVSGFSAGWRNTAALQFRVVSAISRSSAAHY